MSGLLLLATGPADDSKRTKRVQGWSRLNWLDGILIIVSWHIYFKKLLMPLNARMLLCQLGARFTISISSPVIFKSINKVNKSN